MSSSKDGAFSSVPPASSEWPATLAHGMSHALPSALGEWESTRAFGTDAASSPGTLPDAWQATRAQTALATQFLHDQDDYLSGPTQDIGRQTSALERELFVSCDPALALQQQCEHLHPEFIAIHDLATASSRKLLLGIAAASGRGVHKLVIRRQGYGTPLATLEFVELPTVGSKRIRLYSTEIDADTAARHGLTRILMGFSRLTAAIVGELPGHALASALQSLGTDIAAGPWPNRDLLLLPLTTGSQLAKQGAELGRSTGLNVKTTPQVLRPADAWAFIAATWQRLRAEAAVGGTSIPELGSLRADIDAGMASTRSAATAAPVTSASTVAPAASAATNEAASPRPAALPRAGDPSTGSIVLRRLPGRAPAEATVPRQLLERYVRQVSDLTGMLCCCVFEIDTGRTHAQAGREPHAAELAQRGKELLAAMKAASQRLDPGDGCPEGAISLDGCHLLLRGVPGMPRLALHAMLDRSSGNLTLARLQVQRMDSLFEPVVKT